MKIIVASNNAHKIEEFKSFLEDYKVKRRKRVVDRLEDLSLMVTLAKELM